MHLARLLSRQANFLGTRSKPRPLNRPAKSFSIENPSTKTGSPPLPESAPKNLVESIMFRKQVLATGSIDTALASFRQQLQNPAYRPTRHAWNIMIDLCAKNNRLHEAERLYKLMIGRNVIPSEITFFALINGFGRSGNILTAVRYYQEMQQRKIKPTMFVYSSLMRIYLQSGNVSQAIGVWDSMRADGLIPNSFCYNTMLRVLAVTGDWPRSLQLWNEMVSRQLEISAYTFSGLIDCALRKGNRSGGIYLFEMMQELQITPHHAVYHALLRAASGFDQISALLDRMQQRNFGLQRTDFIVCFKYLWRQNDVTSISLLYNRMLQADIKPDAQLLGLLAALGATKNNDELLTLAFSEAERFHLQSSLGLYEAFLAHRLITVPHVQHCIARMQQYRVTPTRAMAERIVTVMQNHNEPPGRVAEARQLLQTLGAKIQETGSHHDKQQELKQKSQSRQNSGSISV